ERDRGTGFDQSRLYDGEIARRRLAVHIDLAALERELGGGPGAIAADELEGQAEKVEAKPDTHAFRRVRSEAPDQQAFRLENIVRVLHPRRHVRADEVDRRASLDTDEFVASEIHLEAFRLQGGEEGSRSEIADEGAIAGCNLADIFGSHKAASAFHVLENDAGLAFEQPADVPHEYPRFGVSRAARRVVDQHR